jgi:Domain of unknown function (DUF4124)
MTRTVLLILCLGIPLSASAEVFKWKDSAGHVHYSDQPPSDSATAVKSATTPSDQAVAAEHELADKDLAFRKRQEDAAKAKEKADKEAEADRIKRVNCERARSNLTALSGNRRIYKTDSNGQRQYMDEQQQADARTLSEKAVAENCR